MANCSEHKNPLQHNGASQAQRLLPGLDKNKFALVDEKEFADWIVFASEFATFINYYNFNNTVAGNWKPFFSSDISAQLGGFAIQNIDSYRIEIKERFDYIKNDDNKLSLSNIKIKLNELFSALLSVSKSLDDFSSKLPEETTLKSNIKNSIKTRLAPSLRNLMGYYKAAENAGYTDHTSLSIWKFLNNQVIDAKEIIDNTGLSDNWFDKTLFADWSTYISSINEDKSIFNNPLTAFADDFLSIEHAANHNLFTGIFDAYLTAYSSIIQDAEKELVKSLENFDAHTPHYALFLCFLRLFRFSQTHINTITQRHLDFYYKEVLRLLPKPAEANKVHVIGELAKQVDSYLLSQATALKSGKDSQNKEVIYALDNDTVFNKAKVAQLKTFYQAGNTDTIFVAGTTTKKQDNQARIFASSVTNSDDGNGAALTSGNKEWHPFVHKVFKEATLESIAMPKAEIGFALASHYLYLTEGERKVFVRFVMANNAALDGKHLAGYLTTEKDWYKIDPLAINSTGKKLSDNITNCLEISFIIPGSAPVINNYNASVHGGSYGVALPVLKIYLVHEDLTQYEYDAMRDIVITKTEIRVEVGVDETLSTKKGIKNLLLSNDFGALDASKPFMPFGSQPKKDTGFVIGHKEIFSKKNACVKFNIEWADLPADVNNIKYDPNNSATTANVKPDVPAAIPQFLEDGIWSSHAEDASIIATTAVFNGASYKVRIFNPQQVVPESSIANYHKEYTNLDGESSRGFLKFSLTDGFGHNDYIRDLSLSLIEKAPGVTKTISNTPIEPYTPKMKSIYAAYSAYCINDLTTSITAAAFNNREIQFFHIYPFGEGEQHALIQPGADVFLLPQFNHAGSITAQQHIGEFYIGIEKLNPGEGVNILFQVMEGTTNPTVAKPLEHINWAFLSNNLWIAFAATEYSDNTLQLVQSGIISFKIPLAASTVNTILPTGYIWLRAAITEAAEAICKIITVDAQASVATFLNNNNAADFLDNSLLPGTISKLKDPDAAIKKINQPYSSFGGRPKENEDHFYVRVSERLRHKARAIMVWDYEHLVLEAFPEIYKVKCLNHTQIEDGKYNEVKPGYVSIITIPSIQNRNDANPLKPFTQQSILTRIENYLRKKISCFVNLRACQPQFEEVRLEFHLKLYEPFKDFTFYADKLKGDITQFLSPWAFDNSLKIDFGGKIYKSVLVNFIEERYYVDFITDVFMYVKVDETTVESADTDEITASTARSILVSAPASKHLVHKL
ncbi:MAG: baseplate J/gp47 family protein [Ferruginibacter sp.]